MATYAATTANGRKAGQRGQAERTPEGPGERELLGLIVLVVLVVKQVGEIVLEEDPLLCQHTPVLPGEGRCGSVSI